MRTRIAAITFICLCLSSAAFGQSAILKGKVVDDKRNPVSNVRILTPDGQADTTDSKGQFTIAFPSTVQPGQWTRLELRDKRDWVIYEPLLGACVTQNAERNFEPLQVIIVPKGSVRALSPERLSQLASKVIRGYASLQEYAKWHGFTLEQVQNEMDKWAKTESRDKKEAAIKALWRRDYPLAKKLGDDLKEEGKKKRERAESQKIEGCRESILGGQIKGNALYMESKFKEAGDAYNEIETLFKKGECAKEDLREEWAGVKVSLGVVRAQLVYIADVDEIRKLLSESENDLKEALDVFTREQYPLLRVWILYDLSKVQISLSKVIVDVSEKKQKFVEGSQTLAAALRAHAGSMEPAIMMAGELRADIGLLQAQSKGLAGIQKLNDVITTYQKILQSYDKERFPEKRAGIHVSLGMALEAQGERLEGAVGMQKLEESLTHLQESLQVYDEESKEWAIVQNNIGIALVAQSERVSGKGQTQRLNEAIRHYQQALRIYDRKQSPGEWGVIQNNLGIALLKQGEQIEGGEGIRELENAIAAFRNALLVDRNRALWFSYDLTWIQNNIGVALCSLGKRLKGPEGLQRLNEAVTSLREVSNKVNPKKVEADHRKYCAAFEKITKGKERCETEIPDSSYIWGIVQNNLGIAMIERSKRYKGAVRKQKLKEVIAAFQTAQAYDKDQLPQQLKIIQNNLDVALSIQSKSHTELEEIQLQRGPYATHRVSLKVRHDVQPDPSPEKQIDEHRITFGKNQYQTGEDYDGILEQAYVFLYVREELTQSPNDISLQIAFAELNFLFRHFEDCVKFVGPLISKPEVDENTKIGLLTIEIASLSALNRLDNIPSKIDAIISKVSRQTREFKIRSLFKAAKDIIESDNKLSSHRIWLLQVFAAFEETNYENIAAKYIIESDNKFSSHRIWLPQVFAALEETNYENIIEKLQMAKENLTRGK